MGKIVLHTCDVCQSSDSVGKWEVTTASGRLVADLCEKHAKPLTALFDQLERLVVAPGERRRSRPVFRLNPEAED